MSRVYNFSAGPAVLPEEVLKEVAEEMMDYQGTGMSVMEMSHRSADFQKMAQSLSQNTLYRTAGYCRCRLAGGPHHHSGRQFPLCYDSAIWHF